MVLELDGKRSWILREVSFELTLQFVKTISKSVQLIELHAFLRLWGSCFLCLRYALVYRLFAAHLQHNKKVDNVGLVPTNTY